MFAAATIPFLKAYFISVYTCDTHMSAAPKYSMPSQAHAGAAQEAPDIGQWEGQDVPLVRPSSCNVKGGIPSSRRYLPTYLNAVRVYTEIKVYPCGPPSVRGSPTRVGSK